MADHVTLTHPDGGEPITVTPLRARNLARQGWAPATDADQALLDAYNASRAAHPAYAGTAKTSTPPSDEAPAESPTTSPTTED
jgi:hypothetical protein